MDWKYRSDDYRSVSLHDHTLRACSVSLNASSVPAFCRITSLIFLEIHQVLLRKIALFCGKIQAHPPHFEILNRLLRKVSPTAANFC